MDKLDRPGIGMASRLLAKAQSTDSDEEAVALAMRSYSLLADAINAYTLANRELPTGARRHERRRLWDRRSARRYSSEAPEADTNVEQAAAVDGYLRLGDGGARVGHSVDFPL